MSHIFDVIKNQGQLQPATGTQNFSQRLQGHFVCLLHRLEDDGAVSPGPLRDAVAILDTCVRMTSISKDGTAGFFVP